MPNGSVVWIASGTVTGKLLPVRRPDHVIVSDAHLLPFDPGVGRHRLYVGEMAEGAHWFYALTHGENAIDTVKIPVDEVIEAFPDAAEGMMSSEDPAWNRMMLLYDEPIHVDQRGLVEFCYDRLQIRSDKPIEFLTERQRSAAKDQLHQKQRIIPFDIHAGQKVYLAKKEQMLAERGGKPWFIVLKSRRIGITALEQAVSYRVVSTQPYSDVATLTHKMESSQRIFGMVSMFHQLDRDAVPLMDRGSKSALRLANGSNFFIGTAGGEGFLRGEGVARVHWSEVSKSCRGPHQFTKVADLWAGLAGAASHGEVTLETTANGKEWFWAQWQEAIENLNEFKPIFLRWFDDPLNRLADGTFNVEEILDTLNDDEVRLQRDEGLDINQIAFRREMRRIYKRLTPQEMPEDDKSCFLSTGVNYFDPDAMTALLESVPLRQATAKVLSIPGGKATIWSDPLPNRKYVIGVDTSEGIPGNDRGGIGILDKESGEQVAAVHGYFRPRLLAEIAVEWSKRYNNALLGIERQNHGHAVLQRVVEHGAPFNRPHFRGGSLYYYKKGETLAMSREGWSTDGQTRDMMLDDLADAISQGWMKVNDPVFVDEMTSFNLQTNGRFEADPAAHDDAVMKWAIAWQMRKVRMPSPSITVL